MDIKVWKWNEFLEISSIIDSENYKDIPPDPEDICTIMYTSGTTGIK